VTHECQIAVNWAGTVARCWFIPDTRCAAQSPTRFRLADDSRKNGWSIGALIYKYHTGTAESDTSNVYHLEI